MKMLKKAVLLAIIMTITLLPLLSFGNAKASGNEADILQVYVSGQTMYAFTDAALSSDALSCLISNQAADITGAGVMTNDDTHIKTTILVDVSTSMPRSARNNVIAALQQMIERKPANEEYRLIAFGEDVVMLQDFTSDRYDLSNAVSKIQFEDKETKIYEAIINTIASREPQDASPTFFRTVVMTDGVDYTNSGITKEEFYIRLQNELYPIDVVAVSSSAGAEDRDLSALVRISGGRYHGLDPNTDVQALAQDLSVSGYSYVTAKIPESLQDGTTRQIDISDGANHMSLDFKIPVYSAPATAPQAPPLVMQTPGSAPPTQSENPSAPVGGEPASESEPSQPDSSRSEPGQSGDEKPFMSFFEGSNNVIFAISGVILLILIAACFVFVYMRGKKNKDKDQPRAKVKLGSQSGIGITEFFSDGNPSGSSGSQVTVKINKQNEPGVSWTLPVEGDVLIGRAEHCAVQLEDKRVSREHCKIVLQGVGLSLVHLSTSNKTYLNGNSVNVSAPVQSGDRIRLGQEELQIEYIQALGSSLHSNHNQADTSGSHTEAVF